MSSGTQAVPTPVQLQKDTPAVGTSTGRAPKLAAGTRSPWWVRIVIVLICLLWIIPTFGLAITSFRTPQNANSSGWWTVFTNPAQLTELTLKNYGDVFTKAGMGEAFVNSLAISVPATIIPILIAAIAAYGFTFMTFPGRNFFLILIVALLVVPTQVALVPLLKIYGQLGISGTFLAIWGAHIGFGMPLAIYIIRNYMATLPKEVIESAKIDGASHFQTFWRLILPMSTPVLASFAIFQFLWVWNDLLNALIFIGPGPNQPLTLALVNLLGQQGQGWQLLTAGGLFTMIVPIIVFLSLQRYFVRGLTAGSVKG
jgi:alpha-glucoside transport system permease protein